MMNKFRNWYLSNYTEITWFLIGFLIYDALYQLSRGNSVGALISFGLAAFNFFLSKR